MNPRWHGLVVAGLLRPLSRCRGQPCRTLQSWLILAVAATLALAGCKILPTPAKDGAGGAPPSIPTRWSAEMWAAKVVPYLEQKGRSVRRGHCAGEGRSGGGGRQIRQSEEAGQFALDLCGQARRQDRRLPTRSRARQRSTSMSTATARPTARCRSARRSAARRCATRWTSSTSTTSPTRSTSRSSARRSTRMPTGPCFPSCRASSSKAARAKVLGAYPLKRRRGSAVVTPVEADIGPAP